MDTVLYGLLSKRIKSFLTGIGSVEPVPPNKLKFTNKLDNSQFTVTLPMNMTQQQLDWIIKMFDKVVINDTTGDVEYNGIPLNNIVFDTKSNFDGNPNKLYCDITENKLYRYNGSSYVVIGGGGGYTGKSGVDLGGIKLNQQFNNASVQEMFDFLLHPYEKPSMTLGINPAKTIYDSVSETLASITINANVTKKSENIKEVRFYIDNVLVHTDTTHPTGGLVSYTHTFSPATNTTFNVKIECEDIKAGKVSANTTITFIGKSYYGYLKEGTTIDETNIKTLNTVLKKDLKYKYSAITTPGTDLYHIVLCQPKELGTITSVKDALNFEYIQDYTIQDITVDGLDYKLMYLTNPVSVTDFLQDFK